jgi:hypothetical protein
MRARAATELRLALRARTLYEALSNGESIWK